MEGDTLTDDWKEDWRRLRRFERDYDAGRATRADWPLWCWICERPQVVAVGHMPLIECNYCYEKTESEGADS